MAKTFFPFDTSQVMEGQWVKMAKYWRTDGVLVDGLLMDGTIGDLIVEKGTGLQVTVGSGKAWVQGHYFESDATETLTVPSNLGGVSKRIDRIALEVDWVQNQMNFVVIQGGTDGLPSELPNSSAKHYIPLAQITVSNTADEILSLFDEREPSGHKSFHNSIVLRKTGEDPTIAANTTVDILWNLQEIDSMMQHDGSGGNSETFTLKEDGQYHLGFNLSVSCTTGNQLVKTIILRRRDGVEQGICMDSVLTHGNNVQVGLNAQRLMNCKKGDQFFVRFTNYSTTTPVRINVSGLYSPIFYAEKVGPVGYSFSSEY